MLRLPAPVVGVDWLREHLDHPSLRVVDARWSLAGPAGHELYAEGHRWVDMRRFGRLGDLPIDREGDDVWSAFPIPEAENV